MINPDMRYNYSILIILQVSALVVAYLLLETYLGLISILIVILYAVLAYIPMVKEAVPEKIE